MLHPVERNLSNVLSGRSENKGRPGCLICATGHIRVITLYLSRGSSTVMGILDKCLRFVGIVRVLSRLRPICSHPSGLDCSCRSFSARLMTCAKVSDWKSPSANVSSNASKYDGEGNLKSWMSSPYFSLIFLQKGDPVYTEHRDRFAQDGL